MHKAVKGLIFLISEISINFAADKSEKSETSFQKENSLIVVCVLIFPIFQNYGF